MMDDPMGMDDLQVDDLFGDDAGLSLMDGQSLPSRPPTKELRQRMDELRGSGCCQYVLVLVFVFSLVALSMAPTHIIMRFSMNH